MSTNCLDETSMHLWSEANPATASGLERCEDCHLHYDDEEMEHGHKCSACGSLEDLDADDFWNMTLDDLDTLSIRSSPAPDATTNTTRRRSDGMVGLVSTPLMRERQANNQTNQKALPRRSVSFGNVQVRVCERVLGDNPACASSGGPSLSIGWKYDHEEVLDLESWESQRATKRRSYSELVLSPETREKIAKKYGFSQKDIEENVKRMAKYQRRRERTLKELEKNSLVSLLASGRSLTKPSNSNHNHNHNHNSNKATLARFLKEASGNSKHARTALSLRSV